MPRVIAECSSDYEALVTYQLISQSYNMGLGHLAAPAFNPAGASGGSTAQPAAAAGVAGVPSAGGQAAVSAAPAAAAAVAEAGKGHVADHGYGSYLEHPDGAGAHHGDAHMQLAQGGSGQNEQLHQQQQLEQQQQVLQQQALPPAAAAVRELPEGMAEVPTADDNRTDDVLSPAAAAAAAATGAVGHGLRNLNELEPGGEDVAPASQAAAGFRPGTGPGDAPPAAVVGGMSGAVATSHAATSPAVQEYYNRLAAAHAHLSQQAALAAQHVPQSLPAAAAGGGEAGDGQGSHYSSGRHMKLLSHMQQQQSLEQEGGVRAGAVAGGGSGQDGMFAMPVGQGVESHGGNPQRVDEGGAATGGSAVSSIGGLSLSMNHQQQQHLQQQQQQQHLGSLPMMPGYGMGLTPGMLPAMGVPAGPPVMHPAAERAPGGYRGVLYLPEERQYQAFVQDRVTQQVTQLTKHETEVQAALAYDQEMVKRYGPMVLPELNFPGRVPALAYNAAAAAAAGSLGSLGLGPAGVLSAAGMNQAVMMGFGHLGPDAAAAAAGSLAAVAAAAAGGQYVTKYKGVVWDPVNLKWQAQVVDSHNNAVLVGLYDSQEEAARAYDTRLIGSGVRDPIWLNFALSKYRQFLGALEGISGGDGGIGGGGVGKGRQHPQQKVTSQYKVSKGGRLHCRKCGDHSCKWKEGHCADERNLMLS